MSVLIKGLRMPESCYACPLCYDLLECLGSAITFDMSELKLFDFCTERHPKCPLRPIPAAWGRLIDSEEDGDA